MKRASYHNHTVFSDGADTPADFMRQAVAQGIEILGFSDHYYREGPGAQTAPEWALQPRLDERYFENIAEVAAHAPIEIRVGLEFDWLDGSAAWYEAPAKDPRLDYTIGSVHFVGTQSIDTDGSPCAIWPKAISLTSPVISISARSSPSILPMI